MDVLVDDEPPQRRFRDRSRGRPNKWIAVPPSKLDPQRRFRDRSRGRAKTRGRWRRKSCPQRRFRDRSRGRRRRHRCQAMHRPPSTKVPRPKSRKGDAAVRELVQLHRPSTKVPRPKSRKEGALVTGVDYLDRPQRRFRDRSRGRPLGRVPLLTPHQPSLNEGSATEVAEGSSHCRWRDPSRPSTKVPRPKSRKVERRCASVNDILPQRRFRDRSRGRTNASRSPSVIPPPQRRFRDRSRGRVTGGGKPRPFAEAPSTKVPRPKSRKAASGRRVPRTDCGTLNEGSATEVAEGAPRIHKL